MKKRDTSKTTEDKKVFWINVYPPSDKDLNALTKTLWIVWRIKVPSISWFLIMNFNFGSIYITNCGLKWYVYILEIVHWYSDKLLFSWNFCLWMFDTEQLDETSYCNAHGIGIPGSFNDNSTNTSSTSTSTWSKKITVV